jgi:rare lipoprotein A
LRITSWRLDIRAVLVMILLSLGASCATQPELPQDSRPNLAPTTVAPATIPPSLPVTSRISANPSRVVRASFEGNAQAGHMTASGDPYNPNDLTAASRTLPIGSSLVVTNPTTGRSVKVRINDRGPYVGGRSLDLSKRAAEKIGLTDKGVARVKVKRADSTSENPTLSSAEDPSLPSTPNSYR